MNGPNGPNGPVIARCAVIARCCPCLTDAAQTCIGFHAAIGQSVEIIQVFVFHAENTLVNSKNTNVTNCLILKNKHVFAVAMIVNKREIVTS